MTPHAPSLKEPAGAPVSWDMYLCAIAAWAEAVGEHDEPRTARSRGAIGAPLPGKARARAGPRHRSGEAGTRRCDSDCAFACLSQWSGACVCVCQLECYLDYVSSPGAQAPGRERTFLRSGGGGGHSPSAMGDPKTSCDLEALDRSGRAGAFLVVAGLQDPFLPSFYAFFFAGVHTEVAGFSGRLILCDPCSRRAFLKPARCL